MIESYMYIFTIVVSSHYLPGEEEMGGSDVSGE
jgi:hypothetical protein